MRRWPTSFSAAFVDVLLRGLNPVSDEAALFTFDKRLRQKRPFTNDV
jgi:hypothetical protein